MKSKEILPEKDRINDNDHLEEYTTDVLSSLLKVYNTALISAEKEIEELNELLQFQITSNLDIHKELVDKYAEISWEIERLANNRDSDSGISNSKFGEIVREFLDFKAKEKYKQAHEFCKWANINKDKETEILIKIAAEI